MAVKPILFSGPMVRALLEGRKTQTRRILKPQPPDDCGTLYGPEMYHPVVIDKRTEEMDAGPAIWGVYTEEWGAKVPYEPGDLLWVRESWRTPSNWDTRAPGELRYSCLSAGYDAPWSPTAWEADGRRDNWGEWREHEPGRLRPGIHLPREFSRLTLEVTSVKVERLQEITDDDAKAEGATSKPCPDVWRKGAIGWSMNWPDVEPAEGWGYVCLNSPRLAFGSLWNDINGEDAWCANPWVVAVSFAVHKQNVDAYLVQQKQVAA